MSQNITTPQKYFDLFEQLKQAEGEESWNSQSVHGQWNGSTEITRDEDVLIAVYSYENYSGSAFIVFLRDGQLYEAHDGHCSCHGLDQWEPEATTWAALKMRDYSEYGTEFNEAFKALVSQHE